MSDETRELREALEKVQHENKQLRGQLAEVQAFKPEELLARIDTLELEKVELRTRLERADLVREDWDRRFAQLRRELDAARQEQERLRSLLENERLSKGR